MADELDSLYWVQPDAFTAERTLLLAAAKKRGDAAAAKRISAARKPTTAAWVVNRLALSRKDTKERLADLGDRLRAAHAAMDGEQIRALSAEQHRLIEELTRAAFDAADLTQPSAAVRDDLTSTLQAAVADPDVAARLGRLAKPERWSGFGAFGDAAPAATISKARQSRAAKQPPRETAAQRRQKKLNAALAAAERAKAEADDALSRRQAELDAARQRRDQARADLRRAEREFNKAEAGYDKARRAGRAAADSVKEAKAQLKRA